MIKAYNYYCEPARRNYVTSLCCLSDQVVHLQRNAYLECNCFATFIFRNRTLRIVYIYSWRQLSTPGWKMLLHVELWIGHMKYSYITKSPLSGIISSHRFGAFILSYLVLVICGIVDTKLKGNFNTSTILTLGNSFPRE